MQAALPPDMLDARALDELPHGALRARQSASAGAHPDAGGGVGSSAEASWRIGGLHCAACAGTVEHALRQVAGVLAVRVSAATHGATVRWDAERTHASALVRAIEAAGYQATPDTGAAARAARQTEWRAAVWRLFVAAFCAMQIMMFAAPAYFSGPDELAADHKRLLDWGSWLLTLPVLCFAAQPFFAGAWRSVVRRRIGMDVPVALGIAVAFVASSGAAFEPGGPFGADVYFDSLAMFISFLLGGRLLELRARHRAEAALEAATGQLPQTVMRQQSDGRIEEVSVQRLLVADRLRIPVGQAFAADGVLLEGSTEADESLLTGESAAVAKRPGDVVVAGSVNLLAPVLMRADRVGADTGHQAIVAMMRAARSQRPALLASADRWAAPFTWGVLLLAAAAGAIWSVVEPSRAVWVVVSVLIVTCPCALSLAAPSALLAATGALARRGLLLRRLDAIQGLARMQTLFVDKTGTLTEGRLRCVDAQRLNASDLLTVDDLRGIAASLAGWSTHPRATALRDGVAAGSMTWHSVHEFPGRGLEGVDADGARWRLGAAVWTGATAATPCAEAADDSQTWLASDGAPRIRFSFEERLRDDALAAVQALQADGVAVHLLSGDGPRQAHTVVAALGLDHVSAALTPGAKLAEVRAAQCGGRIVGMLGDGINDAPVLAMADVSIAMGEGALIARTQADGVLVSNRLGDVVRARALARRALRVVRQNFAWAAAYNAACVPMALLGWLPPWAAGLGMASSSLVVVMNSLRLAR